MAQAPAGPVLTAAQVATVEAAVRRQLRDPDSARFERVEMRVDAKGARTVCGLVNARNAYGGYVGAQPFFGLLVSAKDRVTGAPAGDVFAVLQIGGSAVEQTVTRKMCARQGMVF